MFSTAPDTSLALAAICSVAAVFCSTTAETLSIARTISLAEVGALELRPVPTDLATLAGAIVDGFAPAAELAGVMLTMSPGAPSVVVTIDEETTRRVLVNLVSNALRHSPAEGQVTLRVLRSADGGGSIEVADTGSGMDAELAAHDFYTDMADLFAGREETRKMLLYIAKMEMGHYKLLEHEKEMADEFETFDVEWPMVNEGP